MVFNVDGPKTYKVLLDENDSVRHVFLPLSHRTILVGSRGNVLPSVPEDLLHGLARCSLEYFIAHENSDENNLLRAQIGEDAHPLTKDQMDEIIVQIMYE